MAKKQGISGWHSMRKEQLVRALMRKAASAKASAATSTKSAKRRAKPASGANGGKTVTKLPSGRSVSAARDARLREGKSAKRKTPRVLARIQTAHAERDRLKDLASAPNGNEANGKAANGKEANGKAANGHPVRDERNVSHGTPRRDRVVLLVRDPYWLHACWEITRNSVDRARAAMAEHWHTARPVLRLIQVETGSTTSSAERVAREIEIHGGVNNWYIDVSNPPQSYRVDIGYKAANNRFVALARSNSVTTPRPGSSDVVDRNWTDIARDYERVFSLSGGYSSQPASDDLREVFEEQLRRPMGTPLITKYGVGADAVSNRRHGFAFEVDAELIVFGKTRPEAHVTMAGQPVKLRPDGTFTVRRSLPDRREVLPVVACSGDGLEQRTVILAIERNTKIMEPVSREPTDQRVD
jgi:hypothetical protein